MQGSHLGIQDLWLFTGMHLMGPGCKPLPPTLLHLGHPQESPALDQHLWKPLLMQVKHLLLLCVRNVLHLQQLLPVAVMSCCYHGPILPWY